VVNFSVDLESPVQGTDQMLMAISYKDISRHGSLFISQFQLRHREFIERQQYDVKTLDGMEFDEYDTLASVYLVYTEDGKTVLGASRLTPITYGCMLADHFADLVDDKSIFDAENVWEGTRFCIDSRLPAEKRLKICHHICAGYVEYGLLKGIDNIIGLMPTLILRSVFERSGICLDRLGAARQIGAHSKIQAASIAVHEDQLCRVGEKTGISNVLTPATSPRVARDVA
jgi:acyl homoserine lactone synthase